MIKIVSIEMFEKVLNIYKSATQKMEEMNIHQWDEVYPDSETIHNDITSSTMYGYFIGSELCAIQVINNIQSIEYSQINWKYTDNNPVVLHRLCVDPMFQNKGISKQMILFAENFAIENKYKTIRFDAFINNPISVNIYRKMGFIESGIITFRKGDFYCFEKKTIHYGIK
jgi:RimJ/RimL family protein N-acetyltransferase